MDIYNINNNLTWGYFTNRNIVGGPIQFFRKKCWKEIGGFYKYGGHQDYFAVVKCRMKNWEVESFPELIVLHHKNASLPGKSQIKAKFHLGQMDRVCGELFI